MLRTKPKDRVLSEREVSTLTNAARIALDTFRGYVKEYDAAGAAYAALSEADKAKHDTGMIHGRAYKFLSEQFASQADETQVLLELLIDGDDPDGEAEVSIIVRIEPED